ncbi:MAG: MASE3 domain-containing protein [Candidatus Brocadiia bacterium]
MEADSAHRREALGRTAAEVVGAVLVLGALYELATHNFLLFHAAAELFSIVIAFGIFALCWNSRRFLRDNYLVFLGIAYLFVAGIDTLHTLAYSGMGVFEASGANLATQLWIGARGLESVSLLAAALLVGRRVRPRLVAGGYAVVTALLLSSIFWWKNFPACYVQPTGLTAFKVGAEYAVVAVLAAAGVAMLWRRRAFDKFVLGLLVASVVVTMASELVFTLYHDVTGLVNLSGHFLKIVSFYLIYKAIIETGIVRPYSLLFRDLKESEQRLAQQRARLEAVLRQLPAGVIIAAAPSGRTILANEEVERIWRRPFVASETIEDYSCYPAFHADGRPYEPDEWPLARAILQGETVDEEEMDVMRDDGTLGSILTSAAPIRDEDGTVRAAVMTMHDVTERNRARDALRRAREGLEVKVRERTAELAASNAALHREIQQHRQARRKLNAYQEELRSLASELALAEERSRRQMAQVLHDDLGQKLAMCKIDLGGATLLCESEEAATALRNVRELVEDCIESTRTLTFELGSPLLYEIGLEAALENLAEQTEKRHDIPVKFTDDGQPKPLQDDMRAMLFQATRELLVNALKHADADTVHIGVRREDTMVRVSVQDDGTGFDMDTVLADGRSAEGYGLFSIRERIEHLGGWFRIESEPGVGTTAHLAAPLHPQAAQEGGR